jgi:hypothetical protein
VFNGIKKKNIENVKNLSFTEKLSFIPDEVETEQEKKSKSEQW